MNNQEKDVIKIQPSGIFTNYIFKSIPLAFDESLSYYETLCGLLAYLKNVEKVVNNNADVIVEVQQLMTELQSYVDNYFKNLDVQNEINNKLDEMAESGQLADIIARYLELNGVLAFNTKEDLKNATNISDGSFTYTYGTNVYNDGKGRFYKIRILTSEDVVDNINILALTNFPTLIAELMPDEALEDINTINSNINTINSNIKTINSNIDTINSNIDTINSYIINKTLKNKSILCIGDSWAYGTGSTDNHGWIYYLQNLTNANIYTITQNGGGFGAKGNTNAMYPDKVYSQCITEFASTLSEEERNKVELVIAQSGHNDQDTSRNPDGISAVNTGIDGFITNVKSNFPNAKIMVISTYAGKITNGNQYNVLYSIGRRPASQGHYSSFQSLFWFYNDTNYLNSDGIHLNNDGYNLLAKFIYALYNGWDGIITYSSLGGTNGSNVTGTLYQTRKGSDVILSGSLTYTGVYSGDTLNTLGNVVIPTHPIYIPCFVYADDKKYCGIIRILTNGKIDLRKTIEDYPSNDFTVFINTVYNLTQ